MCYVVSCTSPLITGVITYKMQTWYYTYLELLPPEAIGSRHHSCSEFLSQLVSLLLTCHPSRDEYIMHV